VSTRAHRSSSGGGRHHTVAQLVARERAAPDERDPESGSTADGPRGNTHARRGSADAATTGEHSTHVTELLRRERDAPAAVPAALAGRSGTRAARTITAGRAAVLVGLTVGGMVGLQSTAATPLDHSQWMPEALSAATAHAHHRAPATNSETVSSNTASAPSSTQVELRGEETPLDQPVPRQNHPMDGTAPTSHEQPATITEQASSAGSDSPAAQTRAARQQHPRLPQQEPHSADARPGTTSTDTGTSSPDRSRSSQPSRETTTDTTRDEQSADAEDGGLLAPLLDPVAGTLTGVLDAGTSLLGG